MKTRSLFPLKVLRFLPFLRLLLSRPQCRQLLCPQRIFHPDVLQLRADPIYLKKEKKFFKQYLAGKAEPRIAGYHPVPSLLARSEKGREAFETAWNKYVSPGSIISTESKPEVIDRYFALGPSLAQRVLWE